MGGEMIRERPGEKNDREQVLSNVDNDRHQIIDYDKFGDNYEKAFGEFIPWWKRKKKENKS